MKFSNRASLLTRYQKLSGSSSSYITNMIGFERNLSSKKIKRNNHFILGLMMLNERTNGGILSNNYFNLALSNNIKLTENGTLKLALSGTYANKILNLSSATFQSQFGSFGFMNGASNYDPIPGINSNHIEINSGIAYQYLNSNFDYELGGAIFHASRPQEGQSANNKYILDPRGVGHATFKWRPSTNGEFMFSGNMQVQSNYTLILFGGTYTYLLQDEAAHKLTLGLWNKFNESLYPYFAMKVNGFEVGLSYNIVSGKSKTLNALTSIEASMTWDFGK